MGICEKIWSSGVSPKRASKMQLRNVKHWQREHLWNCVFVVDLLNFPFFCGIVVLLGNTGFSFINTIYISWANFHTSIHLLGHIGFSCIYMYVYLVYMFIFGIYFYIFMCLFSLVYIIAGANNGGSLDQLNSTIDSSYRSSF